MTLNERSEQADRTIAARAAKQLHADIAAIQPPDVQLWDCGEYWGAEVHSADSLQATFYANTEADARAKAARYLAANDLLAACEAAKKYLDTYHDAGELHTQLRSAITAARGGVA